MTYFPPRSEINLIIIMEKPDQSNLEIRILKSNSQKHIRIHEHIYIIT